MVDVDDEDNEGAGHLLKEKVWNAVRAVMEDWTGQVQAGSSIYGVRSYTSGAILLPHVDRYVRKLQRQRNVCAFTPTD